MYQTEASRRLGPDPLAGEEITWFLGAVTLVSSQYFFVFSVLQSVPPRHERSYQPPVRSV